MPLPSARALAALATATGLALATLAPRDSQEVYIPTPAQVKQTLEERVSTTEIDPVRITLLADTGATEEFREVLSIARYVNSDLIVIAGDFGYDDDCRKWTRIVEETVPQIPVLAAIGNHDVEQWECYSSFLENHMAHLRTKGVECIGELGMQQACTYKDLFFVLSGIGVVGDELDIGDYSKTTQRPSEYAWTNEKDHLGFIRDQLSQTTSPWPFIIHHKNLEELQIGRKGSEVPAEVYEIACNEGVVVGMGHSHTYSRTKTLTCNLDPVAVAQGWESPDENLVSKGATFAFVSGLGGRVKPSGISGIRDQRRCINYDTFPDYPYGCNGEWAAIDSSTQHAKPGVLVMDFGVDNNPYKAQGFFLNVDAEVRDEFTVYSVRNLSSTSLASLDAGLLHE